MATTETVYLGQFTHGNADRIVEELERRNIVWWHKQPGRFARFVFAGDWGVRLFVDAERQEEARAVVVEVTGEPPR